MVITGLSLEQVATAAAYVSAGVIFKGKQVAPGKLEGYFSAKYAPEFRAWDTTKGKHHPYHPCACFYGKLRDALKANGHHGWSMTLWKHKLYTYNMGGKAQLALIKHGLCCKHSDTAVIPPAPTVAPTVKASKVATPSGTLVTLPMLAGAELEPGEPNVNVAALKGKARPVYAVTTSLYILEECKIAALRVPSSVTSEIPDHMLMRACQAVQWRNRVIRYAEHYANTLARNFFDFLTIACYGEARHKQGGGYTFDDATMTHGRSSAYQSALKNDPRDLLPKLSHIFYHYKWGGSFGGPKWGKIADTAALYFKPEFRTVPIAFVDHCVDLAHNGGLAFNKGYILKNPENQSAYMTMLDEKRNGSLLDSPHSHPITPDVAELLATGVGLGLIRRPKATFKIEPDVAVPVLTWGSEQVKLYHGHGSITSKPTIEQDTEDTANAETYPVR